MVWIATITSVAALGVALWLGWEVAGLKQRWARLYSLRAAMVETETALQEMMDELDKSGRALLKELDARLVQAQGIELSTTTDSVLGGSTNGRLSSLPKGDAVEKRAAVIGLSQLGYTVEEIARELGTPRGEVQLILDLERVRQ